jgi:hypothetical protein
MANLFDTANALTKEPTDITAGSFVQWTRSDLAADYAPASYDLIYTARIRGGENPEIKITATASNGLFLATISNAVSALYVPGDYFWQAEIQRKSDNAKVLVDRGSWKIIPSLDNSLADPRSHAEIMLDKINSLLEGKADKDVSSYSIQGRSIAKMNINDLIAWRDYYRKEIAREKVAANIAAGKQSGATIKARFL